METIHAYSLRPTSAGTQSGIGTWDQRKVAWWVPFLPIPPYAELSHDVSPSSRKPENKGFDGQVGADGRHCDYAETSRHARGGRYKSRHWWRAGCQHLPPDRCHIRCGVPDGCSETAEDRRRDDRWSRIVGRIPVMRQDGTRG